MDTGINAWLANRPQDKKGMVELPGGFYWEMGPDHTGVLRDPQGKLCAGYDLETNMMRFGSDGMTEAPGLNLWVAQEMGERFARECFMDEKICMEYDTFAKERMTERRTHEKGARARMSGLVQLELKEGAWTAHVDTEGVRMLTGIEAEPELTGEAGVALFNRMSEKLCCMPLRDPLGYMVLENNTYDYVKDQYDFQYNDTIDNIDAGFINGNGRGCEAVLAKLDATVRKNMREYCLPEGVNYQDLRHIPATDGMKAAVDAFVKQRVTKTVNFEKKRSHSAESLAKDHEKFLAAADTLKEKISEAALVPFDVSKLNDRDIVLETM